MNQLQQRALASLPMTVETVEDIYTGRRSGTAKQCLEALCESHERLRVELKGVETLLTEQGLWGDWRQKLRDFANDSEQHAIDREQWQEDRSHGITLYAAADFFTAYFDDAAELCGQANDDLPMFHVTLRSDPPSRTCIHALHLAVWAQHCAEVCLPLQIRGME